MMKLTMLSPMSSVADHPCLNQFVLLCPSYLFLPKPSLILTVTFLGTSQLFPLTAQSVLLPHPHSSYCPYYRPCMCSEEQFLQQLGTFFNFLLHSSEKSTELQKVERSIQKPPSEIHSNLVSLIDPCVTIRIEDIYNHWVLALFVKTSH